MYVLVEPSGYTYFFFRIDFIYSSDKHTFIPLPRLLFYPGFTIHALCYLDFFYSFYFDIFRAL